MDALREHLMDDHGRWCGELVNLEEFELAALHELDHYEAGLGLVRVGHSA